MWDDGTGPRDHLGPLWDQGSPRWYMGQTWPSLDYLIRLEDLLGGKIYLWGGGGGGGGGIPLLPHFCMSTIN